MVVYRKEANDLDPLTGNTAAQSIEETANEGEKTANSASLLAPRAILTCRPNSHPFQERHLILDQPVKVGRSVVRCRCGLNNAIFDCKVLSRNHALMWYENGKFYLQDTKSSNGTFVNNQRLSKGSEESLARELCSGDIVQFGVDVVENARKVVHGCIVATIRLFLPDGKEAKASPTTTVVLPCPDASISSQELYQLSQYLQEALHREQVLESKLFTLQAVVANTQDESNIGWKALIEEDRLLSRIETLESQLQTCSKNVTEEKLRDDVLKLQDDKDEYQNAAKESLKKVLQEKLEAMNTVKELEATLSTAKNECNYLKDVHKNTEQEMQELLEKNSNTEKEISELSKKLEEAEEKYNDMVNQTADEKIENENRVEEMEKAKMALAVKIEALEAENDFSKEQLESLKARLEMLKERQLPDEQHIETNGLYSPTHDDLERTSESPSEKKALIQELFSEVNRRVTEGNMKIESMKYPENDEYHTNGDIKSTDYVNQLQAEIQQLKKLLSETRESKRAADSELVQLKTNLDESQNNLKKLQDELELVQQQLDSAQQQVNVKSAEVSKLEDVNSELLVEDKDDVQEKFLGDASEISKIQECLQRTQKELKISQDESQTLKQKVADLTTEIEKNEISKKALAEYQSICKECSLHRARIEALESETRKYRNLNTQLEADNKVLMDKCSRLESAKTALENKSNDYWKEQCMLTESKASGLDEKLSEALQEILMIKDRFAECNNEKARYKQERDSINEQLQLVSVRSHLSYAFCAIPVIVLVVAAMMAFYPSLAYLTATSDQT